MSLAQRVRDIRYAKGWGPDELANRAEISRTALYQIESGKTGLPRAGTLRRIAVALEVPMEDLLGFEERVRAGCVTFGEAGVAPAPRVSTSGCPLKGGRCRLPNGSGVKPVSIGDSRRIAIRGRAEIPVRSNGHEAMYLREGELMSKLHDLLHSPIGNRRRADPRGASRDASPVPFFDLIGGFGTRPRFIG